MAVCYRDRWLLLCLRNVRLTAAVQKHPYKAAASVMFGFKHTEQLSPQSGVHMIVKQLETGLEQFSPVTLEVSSNCESDEVLFK